MSQPHIQQVKFKLWLTCGARVCELNRINPRFLSLNSSNTVSQIILCVCVGGLFCAFQVIIIASMQYMPVAPSLQAVTTKNISKHCHMFPGEKIKLELEENHWISPVLWCMAISHSVVPESLPSALSYTSTSASHWGCSCLRTPCLWSWKAMCWSS